MLIFDKKRKFYSSNRLTNRYWAGFGTKRFKFAQLEKYPLIRLNQIHSNRVVVIENYQQVKRKQRFIGDGLVTNLAGLALLISTADCLPVIYLDQKNGIVAISHNGWRGSWQKISQKVIEAMISLGAEIKEMVIFLGPSIGACCYSINKEREAIFRRDFPLIVDKIISHHQGISYLNLLLLNYLQLTKMGIKKKQIDFSLFCTQCQEETFFSYRRQGRKGNRRMVNFVVKKY